MQSPACTLAGVGLLADFWNRDKDIVLCQSGGLDVEISEENIRASGTSPYKNQNGY